MPATPLASPLTRPLLSFAVFVWAGLSAAVLAAASLPSVAHADVIPADYEPPPCPHVDCPAGTMPFGMVGHGSCGRGCTLPRECGTPESCDVGSACGDTRYCVLRNLPQGRMIVDTVVGQCAADGSCAEGECVSARRCLSTAPPPRPREAAAPRSSDADASCAIAQSTGGRSGVALGGLSVAIALGALTRLRRASRNA